MPISNYLCFGRAFEYIFLVVLQGEGNLIVTSQLITYLSFFYCSKKSLFEFSLQ